MTNEELVARIKAGETDLMPTLWEQVKRYAYKRANTFYYLHYDRCTEMGVEIADLEQEAYLAIHAAVEKFKPEKGVKFLTYAEYRLKQRCTTAANLHNMKYLYRETKLDDVRVSDGSGNEVSLVDMLVSPTAEDELYDFIEQEYQQEYQAKRSKYLRDSLDALTPAKSEAVMAVIGMGIPYAAHARSVGLSRQWVHSMVKDAVEWLKTDFDLSNQLCNLQAAYIA